MNKFTAAVCIISIVLAVSCKKNDPDAGKKFEPSDRYISSKGGLKMRENPDVAGKQISLIPEGEKVLLLEESGADINISGVTGKWSRIKWKENTGWVFGGFLSANEIVKSEILEEHFLKIGIDSLPEAGEGCSALKKADEDSIHGSGGACEKEANIVEDTTVVKNGRVYFKRQDVSGEDCKGVCPELECKSTRTEIFECYIEGSEIMKVKENETFKGVYKCTLISSKNVKKDVD